MASPSRSGSAAKKMAAEALAAFFSSATTFSRPLMTSYCGLKLCSTSTASFFTGRSRTCPREALTT
jgi:hypothetical protein